MNPTPDPAARKRVLWFGPSSVAPTYLGVLGVAVGFALIGLAWADTAGLTVVGLQMPYIVSAGFTGLGVLVLAVVVLVTGVRRQDGARRDRQMETLTETFRAMSQEVDRQLGERGGG